jgi:hypothetical protein
MKKGIEVNKVLEVIERIETREIGQLRLLSPNFLSIKKFILSFSHLFNYLFDVFIYLCVYLFMVYFEFFIFF